MLEMSALKLFTLANYIINSVDKTQITLSGLVCVVQIIKSPGYWNMNISKLKIKLDHLINITQELKDILNPCESLLKFCYEFLQKQCFTTKTAGIIQKLH